MVSAVWMVLNPDQPEAPQLPADWHMSAVFGFIRDCPLEIKSMLFFGGSVKASSPALAHKPSSHTRRLHAKTSRSVGIDFPTIYTVAPNRPSLPALGGAK
jgi:hypothetical protein